MSATAAAGPRFTTQNAITWLAKVDKRRYDLAQKDIAEGKLIVTREGSECGRV